MATKHKKFSAAILCGYEMVDGKQSLGSFAQFAPDGVTAIACCVIGAAALCNHGDPYAGEEEESNFLDRFAAAWGLSPIEANDEEKMPWEHIYGMAKAAGL